MKKTRQMQELSSKGMASVYATCYDFFMDEEQPVIFPAFTDERLADMVVEGYFGTVTESKMHLEPRYDAVLKIVTKKLKRQKSTHSPAGQAKKV